MFKKILVANRGEIAIRIIRTCKRMGVKTVAVYSQVGSRSLHVRAADEKAFLGGARPEESYLAMDKIIQAALSHGCQAIHPGYGFLSENPEFADMVAKSGLTFIGPPASVIATLGDKLSAKAFAEKLGIPVKPGHKECISTLTEAVSIGRKIGYPLMIRPARAGGGRGIRVVKNEADLPTAVESCQNEARKAFGSDEFFMERYIPRIRHIEIQILADHFGNVVHLGERECSIQRKHQKLIEESPSIALDEKLRVEMGNAAILIAKAVNYYSVGTVEFLLDADRHYFFMEMNTRIQVEHPVTEMVSGVDLIEMQILIAEGQEMPLKQENIKLTGWAIECRINAEDVQAGFSPNQGIIEKVSYPRGKNIRVDSGVTDYSVITPYFDSMVAKLIVYAETRDKAITATSNALRKFWIRGIKTTIPFCQAVMNHKKFRKGDFNTSFIEKEMTKLYFNDDEDEMLAAYVAAFDFAAELETNRTTKPDFERGKNISPWVLNKRLKSL